MKDEIICKRCNYENTEYFINYFSCCEFCGYNFNIETNINQTSSKYLNTYKTYLKLY